VKSEFPELVRPPRGLSFPNLGSGPDETGRARLVENGRSREILPDVMGVLMSICR